MKLKQALIQNTAWKAASLVFTFLNNLLIVRLLGVEESGKFFYAVVFLTLLITALRLGIENGITYLSGRYPNSTSVLFYLLFPLAIVQGFVTYYLLRFAHLFPLQFQTGWAVVFVVSNMMLIYINAFYHAQKLFKPLNFIGAIFTCLQTVFFTIFYFGPQSKSIDWAAQIFTVMSLACLCQVLVQAAWFYIRHAYFFKQVNFSWLIFKGLFSYSGLSFISSILFFLITRVDFYFVEKYCTGVEMGNYVQAAKIGQMALVLPGLLGGVVFPYAIQAPPNFVEKVSYLCRVMTALFLILFIALIITGSFMLPWLLGQQFTLVYGIMIASMPGIFCMSMSVVLLSYFEGKNQQGIILIANLLCLLLLISGDALMVKEYGYMAAAIIFSIANFAAMLVLSIRFMKVSSLPLLSLFAIKKSDLEEFRMTSHL